jgi:hypothetical protein
MKKLLTASSLMLATLFASCYDLSIENNEPEQESFSATRAGEQKEG